jgi:hypothetical protein
LPTWVAFLDKVIYHRYYKHQRYITHESHGIASTATFASSSASGFHASSSAGQSNYASPGYASGYSSQNQISARANYSPSYRMYASLHDWSCFILIA